MHDGCRDISLITLLEQESTAILLRRALFLDSSRHVYNTTVPTTCLPHTGFAGVRTPATHAELNSDRTIHIHWGVSRGRAFRCDRRRPRLVRTRLRLADRTSAGRRSGGRTSSGRARLTRTVSARQLFRSLPFAAFTQCRLRGFALPAVG